MSHVKVLHSIAFTIILCLATINSADTLASTKLLVMGDSISEGYGIKREQGWVALLAEQRKKDGRVETWVNASIGGETTQGGLRRLPALLEEHNPGIVIIELGGNDGLRGWPLTESQANLREMVALVQSSGATAIVIAMQMPPNMGARYNRMFRQVYDDECKDPCIIVPEFIERVGMNAELMQSDGIHPTAEAQPLLAEAVAPYIP